MSQTPKFTKFDMVRIKRDPTKSGVIWGEPIQSDGGWQYEIFFSAQDRRFVIEQDIESVVEHETDEKGKIRFGDINDLRRSLLLIKLRQPLADHLYGLYASRTKFEVYQFKPALKFLGNPDQRILIADEVGIGKTIEAGIIYLELQARLDLMRVLVICPPSLKFKWQDEMRSRFDEKFTLLDKEKLETFIKDYEKYGESTRLRGIVTLHLIRRAEIAEQLAELRVNFDLVIIDEAHHMRNPTTLSNNIASILSDNTDAMLLLTATPLHLGNQDLYHLLQILSPGEFDNLEAFRQRIEPNKHINRASQYLGQLNTAAALKEVRQVERYPIRQRFIGNPYYKETISILKEPKQSTEQLVRAQHNLLELNTLSHIFTRTRKREVVTNAPLRVAHSLKVDFSPQERKFYDAVIEHVRHQYLVEKGSWATGWVTIMRERQAASCISALRKFFDQELKDQYTITSEDFNVADELTPDEDSSKSFISEDVESILRKYLEKPAATSLEGLVKIGREVGDTDTKFHVFQNALSTVLNEDPKGKILVFSFFRGTLDYLYKRLLSLGFNVLMMHGGVNINERKNIVDRFREDPGVNILLSSEVGSEGLDFQFCHTLFNYDLPWNPMKVEQRIGRIDRFGQESKRINIYNLVIENSIEERIFLRLYERIGIFQESIGDLEAILGEEIRQISTKIFSTHLTPQQEQKLAEQASRNIIRRKQELEEFEKHRMQFMGQDAIFSDEVRSAIETGKFIPESEIQATVDTFIKNKFPGTRLEHDEDDPTCALIPGEDLKRYMRDFIIRTRSSDQSSNEFLRRITNNRMIPLTYNSEIAYERKLVDFITLRHPLTLAALSYWKQQPGEGLPVYEVTIETENGHSGDYYFFIMLFHSEGMQQNSQLVPILVNKDGVEIDVKMQGNFMRLLQGASPNGVIEDEPFDEGEFNEARQLVLQHAANQRNQRETELQRSNDALANARLNALEQTFQIKSSKVEEYLHNATDLRIKRMRESQLRNIESKYRDSVKKIDDQRKVSVSYSLELAGVATILAKPKKEPLVIEMIKPAIPSPEEPEVIVVEPQVVPIQESAEPILDQVESQPVRAEEEPLSFTTPQPEEISKPAEYSKVYKIKPEQIGKLTRKKGGMLARFTGQGKTPLRTIAEQTGATFYLDRKNNRIKIVAPSEDALEHAIKLLGKEVY